MSLCSLAGLEVFTFTALMVVTERWMWVHDEKKAGSNQFQQRFASQMFECVTQQLGCIQILLFRHQDTWRTDCLDILHLSFWNVEVEVLKDQEFYRSSIIRSLE
jgi:hypothetical protein